MCAISQMTSLLHHPSTGEIDGQTIFQYLIAYLVVLQAWLFQTNYINRFGCSSWAERIVLCVNMIAVMFLSNTIGNDWATLARPFALSMATMLGSVAVLYGLHASRKEEGSYFARNVAIVLAGLTAVYILTAVCSSWLPVGSLSVILPVMVIIGIIVPSFINKGFDTAFVDAGHLIERFELLVILTFGETIVTMASIFDVSNFTLRPVIVFINVILLFGTYVLFVHYMLDHTLNNGRGLVLMYTHFALIIGVNLMTISMTLMTEKEMLAAGIGISIASSALFYGALLANNIYAKSTMRLTISDLAIIAVFYLCASIAIVFAQSLYTLLIVIILIEHIGIFGVLLHRHYAANV